MSLKQWLDNGWLRKHKTDQQEITQDYIGVLKQQQMLFQPQQMQSQPLLMQSQLLLMRCQRRQMLLLLKLHLMLHYGFQEQLTQ